MPIHDWTRVPAGIFHDFHATWLPEMKRALNSGGLPPGYYALVEQIAGGYEPDVVTLETRVPGGSGNGHHLGSSGGAQGSLVQLATAPPQVRYVAEAEADRYAAKAKALVVHHVSDDNVIAVIELVSPGNKGSLHAFRAFVRKAAGLIRAGIHLLVIDLFPGGPRDPHGIHHAIWSEIAEDSFVPTPEQPLMLASYAAGETKRAYVELVAAGQSLPLMPLFVDEESYVNVPLELTYSAAFSNMPARWRDVLD